MFALIAHNAEGRTVLLGTARTRRAIQKKWDAAFNRTHTYRFMGVLTPAGLTNYAGAMLGPRDRGGEIGRVQVKMYVDYD